jgi:hypothetical protein
MGALSILLPLATQLTACHSLFAPAASSSVALLHAIEDTVSQQYDEAAGSRGKPPAPKQIQAYLFHQLRVWTLINALWGEVCCDIHLLGLRLLGADTVP